MNKILIAASIVVALICLQFGISMKSRSKDFSNTLVGIMNANKAMAKELEIKKMLKKSKPVLITKAFNNFVNQMYLMETYSGTRMEIAIVDNKSKSDIESNLKESPFRGVYDLPLYIKIAQPVHNNEITSILESAFILESRTDFKVEEIVKENNDLIIRGDLYGVR